MIHKNQKGIAHLGIVLAIVVLAVLSFGAWRVMSHDKKQPLSNDPQKVAPKTHKEEVAKIQYEYPSSWVLKSEQNDQDTSTTVITSLSGTILTIKANHGGEQGACTPMPSDKPYQDYNLCETHELLTKEEIDLRTYKGDKVYVVTGQYKTGTFTSEHVTDRKIRYFVTLDTEVSNQIILNVPTMGFFLPESASLLVDSSKDSVNPTHLLVTVVSDDYKFLTSQEGQQFKDVLKSFKNTQ